MIAQWMAGGTPFVSDAMGATMATPRSTDPPHLSADEAFSILGDDTRLRILRVLGDADGAMQFSDLQSAVGYEASGNFSYHLEKLTGNFIEKTDEGYALQLPGRRVITAIQSGLIREERVRERAEIEEPCLLCGGTVEVELGPGGVAKYCTACPGVFRDRREGAKADNGYLGTLGLPPAGFHERSPEEAYRAAQLWANLARMARSHGICPKCSAALEQDIEVCEDHDADQGVCAACGMTLQVHLHSECTNCIYHIHEGIGARFYGRSPMLSFLLDAGANPVSSTATERPPFDHAVDAHDPFRGRFIYYGDDELFEIIFDDSMELVEVTRRPVDRP